MGGLRVRVSANQPLPHRIRRDFSRDADHLVGTGAYLLRQGHYGLTGTGSRLGRAASAEPRLPRLDAASAYSTTASPMSLSQSAVFEYDSPGTTAAPQQASKRGPRQLPPPVETRAGPGSAQLLRNLDRYMDRWAAGGQAQGLLPSPSRPQRAASPTRRTATEAGAELALHMAAGSSESGIGMLRNRSSSRMRDRQTSAAYGARVARLRR